MFRFTSWIYVLSCLLLLIAVEIVSSIDVTYYGRKYVSEGTSFQIFCLKSPYGKPEWSRNGVAINEKESDYKIREEMKSGSTLMELMVEKAQWRHRGKYKCNAQSTSSHTIEIILSKETDIEMQSLPNVPLRINQTLKLVCDLEDLEETGVFPISWYKDGSRILAGKKDSRIQMEDEILLISRAGLDDLGEYMCLIGNSSMSYAFADHLGSHIKVTYPPQVKQFPTQTRPILQRSLKLECEVQGFPIPRVSWFVDDIPVEDVRKNNSRFNVTDGVDGLPNSIFILENVKYGDNHKITCAVDNLVGSTETTTILAVRANSIDTNEEEPGKGVILTIGQDLVLQCNNTDNPLAKIEWYKNGEPLNLTDSRLLVESSNNSLVISNTVEDDCGNYTCSSSGASAIIAVRTKVVIKPMDSSRNVDQNRNIVLTCNITQGTPLPEISWLKESDPLNMSDPRITVKSDNRGIEGTEVVIADARFDDRAEYTCIATNEINSVNATILIRVKDKYAALWPFIGICVEVAILCTIIFIYEKRRQKPDFDESETEHNTENKSVPDQEDKGRDVRQRK